MNLHSNRPPLPVTVTRAVRIPDGLRVARCLRAPELGPRLLFFSGGSALRSLSRKLKHYTHNTVHLITPFDSGGSSAKLRKAFVMPSVGDLRNRLMALADETVRGSPEVYALFSHRLSSKDDQTALRETLQTMIDGRHPLVAAVPEPMRRIVRTHLRDFARAMDDRFDLQGASIGNLILAGGYLTNERDIESVIYTFSKLVEARGLVRLVTTDSLQLRAELESGKTIVGQHRLTGKEVPELDESIVDLMLVTDEGTFPDPVPQLPDRNRKLIENTDLLCYPMGSFFSSVTANLLPSGVGRAIVAAQCPKVYIPNTGRDPEQKGYDAVRCVETLLRLVRRDVGEHVAADRILNLVLVDTKRGSYERPIDVQRLQDLGLTVLDAELHSEDGSGRHDPQKLAEALISLA